MEKSARQRRINGFKQFREMVDAIRKIEIALGDKKRIYKKERKLLRGKKV